MRNDLEILQQDYNFCKGSSMNLEVDGSASAVYSTTQERISVHLNDLEDLYFRYKKSSVDPWMGLSDFSKDLKKFSDVSRFKTCAVLHYADNFFNYASSIVSSIEFDKDDEYFAIAGVTKKIRVFEYVDVVRDYGNWSNNFITRQTQGQDDEVCERYFDDRW